MKPRRAGPAGQGRASSEATTAGRARRLTTCPITDMLYVMRTLSIIVFTLLALYGVGIVVASIDAPTTRVSTVASETTKPTESTSAYLARVEREAQAQAQEGAAWRAAHPVPTVRTHAPCGGDAACEDAYGVPRGSDFSTRSSSSTCHEDQPCWDSRAMGNGQAGVGSAHGPRGTRCEPGGTYLVNEYGKRVCQY